ncbi:MAG TPA: enoyl-CoA hydratase/isomerase [Reyranella sp.]|nr:enoyl-CoA hydratase/isomerase [Reyranella sp.]
MRLRSEPPIAYLNLGQAHIDRALVEDCRRALDQVARDEAVHVVVLEGSSEAFCLGASLEDHAAGRGDQLVEPEALYDLWEQLARGPFVAIAHVQGKVNAGGVGFVAACDIVLADRSVEFSLSELLFGLSPACVLPFLIRRVGFQKAHYMTLTTRPVSAEEARGWGLVDACEDKSAELLRRHLLRLRRLSKPAVRRYKSYMSSLGTILMQARPGAIAENKALFSDPDNLATIRRFAETKRFPWES